MFIPLAVLYIGDTVVQEMLMKQKTRF